MTPAARVAAAIDILDKIGAGEAAERALTRWGRENRYAGSKDRAAVRDHVFDVLRNWRSDAARGGAETGRARMIGRLRACDANMNDIFSGARFAPAPLSEQEENAGRSPHPGAEACDVPDWLWTKLGDGQEVDLAAAALQWQHRAQVILRVNTRVTDLRSAQDMLAEAQIETSPNPLAASALTVLSGARRIRASRPYVDGFVELQDASSQAVIEALPKGDRVLDYCAGGGGKSLAMAAQGRSVWAFDADPRRMSDLPDRASRAGAKVSIVSEDALDGLAPFDLVLCDAPCSGSGAWRRSPEGKWQLTPARLDELVETQARILENAARLVRPGGHLVYATCSIIPAENSRQAARFQENMSGWTLAGQNLWPVSGDGDGFYSAHFQKA